MEAADRAHLTDVAKSLIARARVDNAGLPRRTGPDFPTSLENTALHSALLDQHSEIEALNARHAAETVVLTATIDRMEREIAILRGQVDHLIDQNASHANEQQRLIGEARDLAQAYVDRLTENFETRLRTMR